MCCMTSRQSTLRDRSEFYWTVVIEAGWRYFFGTGMRWLALKHVGTTA